MLQHGAYFLEALLFTLVEMADQPSAVAKAIRADAASRGMTLAHYAREIGVDLSDLRNATREPPRSQTALNRVRNAIRAKFDYSDNWPFEGLRTVSKMRMRAIPVAGIANGGPGQAMTAEEPYFDPLWVPEDMCDDFTLGWVMQGDSMSPWLVPGDVVVAQPASRLIPNKAFLVRLPEGISVKLAKFTKLGTELHSINPGFEPIRGVEFTVLGIVTGRYRDYAPMSKGREAIHDPDGITPDD